MINSDESLSDSLNDSLQDVYKNSLEKTYHNSSIENQFKQNR